MKSSVSSVQFMTMFEFAMPPLAVFPVLIGPLQTLLAVLPALLLGVGSMLFAAFKPGGFRKLVRFCWRQKLFLGCVAAMIVAQQSGVFARLFESQGSTGSLAAGDATDWALSRGGAQRLGRGPGDVDPTRSTSHWKNDRDATVFSSPAVSGSRVYFATATGMGPFSPEGNGAIVCADAESGREIWRYAPSDFRATFSSPVVAGGYVVCGEGLHQVQDARVTCLDQLGQKRWEFRTHSHVEATPAIADQRVFIGAGADGFYCLALEPDSNGQPQVLWHLDGKQFPDCESSPVVSEGVVYFGLGEGGFAICAVDAISGSQRWRITTPYPVFAPPMVAAGKLYVATGNGNYVQSAADLLEMKLQLLKDDGATEQELVAARERLKPAGEIWCIDLATQQIDWKFAVGDAVLGSVVQGEEALYFGSRDGHLYRVSMSGQLLSKLDLHEPIVCSAALGRKHVYVSTSSGRLFCLDAATLKTVWDVSLGGGENFVSSPVVAHGHVYVGTAQEGLRCLGQPGVPEAPLWSEGERGGRADDEPIPKSLAVAWKYPSEDATYFRVTAPLMPFDGSIYVAGSTNDGRTQLVKLSADKSASGTAHVVRETANAVWDTAGAVQLTPVGSGTRLCVLENYGGLANRLWCMSPDGNVKWQKDVKNADGTIPDVRAPVGDVLWVKSVNHVDKTTGLAIDATQVFVAQGGRLQSFDLATGDELWQSNRSDSPTVGSPWSGDDLVIFATTTHLAALDAPTGSVLWNVPLTAKPTGGPFRLGRQIVLPTGDQQAVFDLGTGRLQALRPAPTTESDGWLIPDNVGPPLTPRVAMKGRVYFGSANGEVICLGAETP